jgi:hypothetical protein
MAWTTLTFSTLEVLSSTKMTQLQANFTAIMQEAASIPTWTKVTMTPGSAIVPLTIDQNYDNYSLKIDTESTTYDAIEINAKYGMAITQDITNGWGLYVLRNIAEAGLVPLVTFKDDHNGTQQPVLQITDDGTTVGIYALTITSETGGIYCGANHSMNFAGWFFNDGNNENRYGINISNGTDDNSNANVHIIFGDGNGDTVGSITSTGGTVSYNAFTGGHYAEIENFNPDKYIFGKIVILKKVLPIKFTKSECRQPVYEVELSSKIKDSRVFGVYAGKLNFIKSIKREKIGEYLDKEGNKQSTFKNNTIIDDTENYHIYGLGDGFVWVCNQGGNIANGDYITTSDEEGNGMKQDDDLLHSYTIAKSLEDVDWSKEKETSKKIACTYHAS